MAVQIRDPYAVPGDYRKVQLHCHTTESDGRLRPEDLLRMYKHAGYAFVFLTDHNRITRCDMFDDDTFLALPGTEDTVSRIRPLGPHLLRLFVTESLRGHDPQQVMDVTEGGDGLCGLCHPSWTGNLWTGSWSVAAINALHRYHFVEICNPHSAPEKDVSRWAAALRRPHAAPVWGIAVDDCHGRTQFNRAWIQAKVVRIAADDLRRALRTGAFYASTGPAADFAAGGTTIRARFEERMAIRFIDRGGRVRLALEGTDGGYAVQGDEQYIRVEAGTGRYMVWSQPFVVTDGADNGTEGDRRAPSRPQLPYAGGRTRGVPLQPPRVQPPLDSPSADMRRCGSGSVRA